MRPEISIIVPVYKVEKYLRECLDSIKTQSFRDWECLLVDDGSPDDSGCICDEYAARDPRFVVIHRQNGGLSAARNSGLEKARGRYIAFIDSDDSVYPDFLEKLYKLITATGADVVQAGYEQQFTTFSRKKSLVKNEVTLDRAQVANELLCNTIVPSYIWIKLFKKEVITIPFPEGKLFEDIYALTGWAKNIHKMVLIPEILYCYRQRLGSIMNSDIASNRMELVEAFIDRVNTLRELEPAAVSGTMSEKSIWKGFINAGKAIARLSDDPVERRNAMNKISGLCKVMALPSIKILGLKKWLRGYLLRNHPDIFIKEMRLGYLFYFRKRKMMRHLFK